MNLSKWSTADWEKWLPREMSPDFIEEKLKLEKRKKVSRLMKKRLAELRKPRPVS